MIMQLVSVRTNTNFALNYENHNLIPQVELILLMTQPIYKKKGENINKDVEVKEIRFNTSVDGINVLIGELQTTLVGLNNMVQMAASINAVIKGVTEQEKK